MPVCSAQEVPDGIFRPHPESHKNIMAIPEKTVTDLLLFEIVKRLSFENETFPFHLLESAELHLKKDRTLKAMGRDPNRPDLYRYTTFPDRNASFWMDEDRNLVRVLWDNDKEFTLTDEATATGAVR